MWQPRGAGTCTLPSCLLNGNQMGDHIFKRSKYHSTTYSDLRDRNSVYSPYPSTGIITHCPPLHTHTPYTLTPNPTLCPRPPCLLAGVTALLVNKSFPAQVTFGMFNLRGESRCALQKSPTSEWRL